MAIIEAAGGATTLMGSAVDGEMSAADGTAVAMEMGVDVAGGGGGWAE